MFQLYFHLVQTIQQTVGACAYALEAGQVQLFDEDFSAAVARRRSNFGGGRCRLLHIATEQVDIGTPAAQV